jgi:hypothetical protein
MAIIYNDEDEEGANVIMGNDGHGHLVDIPSIFISKKNGDKLISTRSECGESMILSMRFETYTAKVANVTLWLNSNNRQTFITLRDFKRDYYRVIKKHINLSLRFKVNKYCGHDNCE